MYCCQLPSALCGHNMEAEGDLAGSVIKMRQTNSPIIVSKQVFFTVNLGYVHQETDEGKGLEKEKQPILERFCLIYLKSRGNTC